MTRKSLDLTTLRVMNEKRQLEWQTVGDNRVEVSLSFRGNELAGEVGEACNVIKKLERERLGLRGSRATKEQAADELADVIICVSLIAIDLGIDLSEAVVRKFNKTSFERGLKTMFDIGYFVPPANKEKE